MPTSCSPRDIRARLDDDPEGDFENKLCAFFKCGIDAANVYLIRHLSFVKDYKANHIHFAASLILDPRFGKIDLFERSADANDISSVSDNSGVYGKAHSVRREF